MCSLRTLDQLPVASIPYPRFFVIGSRQQLLKIHHCSVRVGTIDIKPVKVARNLGAWFDSHFSMSTHISMSCSAAFFWLHNIKRISQFLLGIN